jgi:Zn-dependent M16 (insulinase) family peptidase
MLLEVGTSKLDETAFSRHMHANTGGVSVSTLNSLKHTSDGKVGDPNDGIYRLIVRGKSTAEKAPVLFDVMLAALTDAKLDNKKRAIEILRSTKAGMESSFSTSGNGYAQRRIFARRSIAGYIDEVTGGISYFDTVKSMLVTAEKDWPSLLQRLEKVRMYILDKESTIINLSADAETLKKVDSAVDTFVSKLPKANRPKDTGATIASHGKDPMRLKSENEGFIVPTQVNFVATGGALFSQGEQVSGAFEVVVRSLSHGYLWDTVRVMGGAYGGSCSLSMVSGTFVCSSYRDPNLAQTLTAFENIAEHLETHPPNMTDMQPAIIGAIGDLDQPLGPDRKGYVSMMRFLSGETLAARQQKRDEIFSTSPADFAAFAKKLRVSVKNWRVSVFGSEAAFSKANAVLAKDSFISAKSIL